jgi:hypothetical protein
MLKDLMKKVFPASADNAASAENSEVVPEMTTQEQQPTAANEQLAEMAAALATATEAQATMQSQMAELATKYAAAEAALAASAQAQEMLISQAKAAKMEARTASLSAVMGDVKGPQMAVALESLGDESFATVLSGYAASFEAESKSEMFSEKGVAAEAAPVVEEDTATRLAASLAATFKTK